MFVKNLTDVEVTAMWDSVSYSVPAGESKLFSWEVCRKFEIDNPGKVQIIREEEKPKVVNDVPEMPPDATDPAPEVGTPPEGTGMAPVEEESLEELNAQYFSKFNKKLVGKWAKDAEWIKSKLNTDGNRT